MTVNNEDLDVIEADEVIAPDPSRLSAGAAAIRDSFSQKQREKIEKAKPMIGSDAFLALDRFKSTPLTGRLRR